MHYLVNFDSWDYVLLDEDINHLLAIGCGLVECLLKQDGSRDVVAKARSRDQECAVGLTVGLSVLKADGGKSLATSRVRLIHGQDSTPWRCYGFLLITYQAEHM